MCTTEIQMSYWKKKKVKKKKKCYRGPYDKPKKKKRGKYRCTIGVKTHLLDQGV